jgi:WD40 repeat protein
LYVQFARYLLPRWHGQRGDIEHFAAEIANSMPGDDGLEAYARIAFKIHQIDTERELLFFGEYDKPLLAKAGEVLMRRRAGSAPETHFAALCAWVAQDRETALRLRPKIEASAENDAVWPWAQQRSEFRYWCDRKEFVPTNETRWFWGSMFYGENLEFWKDSRSIWCGGGYGPSAMNRFEIENGRIVQSLPAPAPGVDCFAVDSANEWVAAGLTGSLYKGFLLWDLAEPHDPWAFPTKEKCSAIAIQPNKLQIAWATMAPTGTTIRLTSVRTGQHTASFQVPGYVRRLRFSADGQLLVVSTEHESIWDPETGQLQHDMPHIGLRPIPSELCKKVLQIDEQGRIWAIAEQTKPISGRQSLIRYAPDTKTWETLISGFEGDSLLPGTAVLSPDKRLLAVNTIGQGKEMPAIEIDIWNVESGSKLKHFSGHFSRVLAMSFSPDVRWLASMGFPTGLVKLWSLDTAESQVSSQ